VFSFNLHFYGSPYFDHDAFAHGALRVGGGLLDDPEWPWSNCRGITDVVNTNAFT